MVKIHETYLRFLNQDMFNSRDIYDDTQMRATIEDTLFNEGVNRYNEQLTRHLKSRSQKESIALPATTNVFLYIDKLYLFTHVNEVLLFEFPEKSSNIERIDMLTTNAQSIREKAWQHILEQYK